MNGFFHINFKADDVLRKNTQVSKQDKQYGYNLFHFNREQNMNMSLEIVDFAYIMETGRMRLSGSPQEILADGDVREFYLGEGKGKYISRKDRWEGKM